MVGGVGEGGTRRRQKEEEDDFVLEEDMKGGAYGLDKCGEANRRQGGLEEDSAREGGSRVEVGQAERA